MFHFESKVDFLCEVSLHLIDSFPSIREITQASSFGGVAEPKVCSVFITHSKVSIIVMVLLAFICRSSPLHDFLYGIIIVQKGVCLKVRLVYYL